MSLPSPGSQTNVSSPCTHERDVAAAVAVDRVVAVAALEHVGAGAAGEPVVAGAAVEGQGDRLRGERGRRERVVAAVALDRELVGRLLVRGSSPSPAGRTRRRRRRPR